MGNLTINPQWHDTIAQIEQTDRVIGGAPNDQTGEGVVNRAPQQLAENLFWLLSQHNDLAGIAQSAEQVTAAINAALSQFLGSDYSAIVDLQQALASNGDQLSALFDQIGTKLTKDQNLADLPDKAQARANLGVTALIDNLSTLIAANLTAANNLSDLTDPEAARANIGVTERLGMVKVARASGTQTGVKGHWTKIATISSSKSYRGPLIRLLISTPNASVGPHYMEATVSLRQISATSNPVFSSGIVEQAVQGIALTSGALRLIEPANYGEPAELWFRTNSDYADFEIAAYVAHKSSVTVDWHSDQGWQAAEPTVPAGGAAIKPQRASHLRPIGERISWPGGDLPYGTVRANGSELLKEQYPALWEYAQQSEIWDAAGTDAYKYRPGSTADHFRLPNWHDMFERATGSGRDPLSFQENAMQHMTGESTPLHVQPLALNYQKVGVLETAAAAISAVNAGGVNDGAQIKFDNQGVVNTADENRPDNIAFHWLIQAF